jgi:dTDP-L-rhamnose 4-epimerase
MEALAKRPVQKLVVASSMSVYGEGPWTIGDKPGAFRPHPTGENHHPSLPNVYALTKYDQERMCLIVGEASGIPTTALRFFNVYGPRQALSNPYTGVIAIFASRLLNDRPPLIYDDGLQSRDFVSVHDIVQACVLALGPTVTGAFNVGTGKATTVLEVAETLARVLGKDIPPRFTGTKRIGDIRHCFADIGKARRLLGYEPHVTLEDGLVELAEWLQGQKPTDSVERAARELTARGLAV